MERQNIKLNPQAIRILDILEGRETLPNGWHCPIEWGYADGHCKRFTDINEYLKPEGMEVIGEWCDCGKHTARIKKRKLISRGRVTVAHRSHNPIQAGSTPAPATNLPEATKEWKFRSETDRRIVYTVVDFTAYFLCNCKAYEEGHRMCWHIKVTSFMEKHRIRPLEKPMTKAEAMAMMAGETQPAPAEQITKQRDLFS